MWTTASIPASTSAVCVASVRSAPTTIGPRELAHGDQIDRGHLVSVSTQVLHGCPSDLPARSGDADPHDDRLLLVGSDHRVCQSAGSPDKREVLAAGQETLSRLLAEGIAEAPADAGPLEAVANGLERASSALGLSNRELGPPNQGRHCGECRTPGTRRTQNREPRRGHDCGPARPGRCRPGGTAGQRNGCSRAETGLCQRTEGVRDDADELAPHTLSAQRAACGERVSERRRTGIRQRSRRRTQTRRAPRSHRPDRRSGH